jgi:hypothetical protein
MSGCDMSAVIAGKDDLLNIMDTLDADEGNQSQVLAKERTRCFFLNELTYSNHTVGELGLAVNYYFQGYCDSQRNAKELYESVGVCGQLIKDKIRSRVKQLQTV